jgi:hypothetical protein
MSVALAGAAFYLAGLAGAAFGLVPQNAATSAIIVGTGAIWWSIAARRKRRP